MTKMKNLSTGIAPNIETQNLKVIATKTGNIYGSINIVAKRANQISQKIKEELHSKLEEFASTTDNLEEVFENREQIEISKYYEKMPNPTLLATEEFLEDKIYHRHQEDEEAQQ